MSYNLLLDTNFTNINKHWKLVNCEYQNGYLIANDYIFGIEQEIILPDPTKLYFSIDYITFDKNIKYVLSGIQTEGVLEAVKKKPKLNTRKKLPVVNLVSQEKIKVRFIVESKIKNSKIYIDSPLLIDLISQHKAYWPKSILNRILDYRYGYDYLNEYKESEITLNNKDFTSPYTETTQGQIGIIFSVPENDWFNISCNLIPNHYYLVKIDYEQINKYGDIYLKYGEHLSEALGSEQCYLTFKADSNNQLKLKIDNKEVLPYLVNLKHILIIDLENKRIEIDDVAHLPFI